MLQGISEKLSNEYSRYSVPCEVGVSQPYESPLGILSCGKLDDGPTLLVSPCSCNMSDNLVHIANMCICNICLQVRNCNMCKVCNQKVEADEVYLIQTFIEFKLFKFKSIVDSKHVFS